MFSRFGHCCFHVCCLTGYPCCLLGLCVFLPSPRSSMSPMRRLWRSSTSPRRSTRRWLPCSLRPSLLSAGVAIVQRWCCFKCCVLSGCVVYHLLLSYALSCFMWLCFEFGCLKFVFPEKQPTPKICPTLPPPQFATLPGQAAVCPHWT